MDLNFLISEQESKLQAAVEQQVQTVATCSASQVVVPDLVPTDSGYRAPNSLQVQQMLSILRDAHGEVIEAFDTMISMIPIQDIWRLRDVRRAVQEFMASESVRDAEEAINRQCMIVITGETDEARETAFRRVQEGIEYWKKLVMWKIRGGR